MFYNAQYNQYVQEGTAFTLGGVQYPANWLNCSTPEEKAAVGLVEVVATNQPGNSTYYWVSETLNGAELTYTNTPKDLDSLKTQCVSQTNQTAYSLLFPSDWMVVKATETGGVVDPAWNTYRADIRATADQTKTAIAATTTVEELQTLMDNVAWPVSPDAPVVEAAPTEQGAA